MVVDVRGIGRAQNVGQGIGVRQVAVVVYVVNQQGDGEYAGYGWGARDYSGGGIELQSAGQVECGVGERRTAGRYVVVEGLSRNGADVERTGDYPRASDASVGHEVG